MKVVESMTRVTLADGRTVRVWRDEEPTHILPSYVDLNQRLIDRIHEMANPASPLRDTPSSADMAHAISKIARVNAVEILEPDGNGVLIYPEWP